MVEERKNPERIQKVLARAGIASRRKIEEWIKEGRISVNGSVATLGDRIHENHRVYIDSRLIDLSAEQTTRVLLYHKPIDEICTRTDPEDRATVYDNLPDLKTGRWLSIGRLDINTSGLLLFTNDGELAHRMMHPSFQLEREYSARVLGNVDKAMMERLTQGVKLEDGVGRFEHIVSRGGEGANRWYQLVVMEGRKRLVRRLWESQDRQVNRLTRVRFGPISLPRGLPLGKTRELNARLVNQLIEATSSKKEKG